MCVKQTMASDSSWTWDENWRAE